VGVDQVVNTQGIATCQRKVAVDLADSGSITAAAQVSAQPTK
jgi:hypothetical protein